MGRLQEDVRGHATMRMRMCIGLLVGSLHLIAIIAILAVSSQPASLDQSDSRSLVLVNIEADARILPAAVPKEAAPAPRERTLIDPSKVDVPSTSESAAAAESSSIQDWRGSLEQAATAAAGKAIREESYRSLGPIERQREKSSFAPSIFETPRRIAGDIDHDAVQGRTLIWHSEHCYTELRFPTIKDQNALIGAPNPPKCMQPIGEREARGDLFESLDDR